jgi:RNA recognition motif-containing protein
VLRASSLVRCSFHRLSTWRTTTLVTFSFPGKQYGEVRFVLRNRIVGTRLYVGNLSYSVTSQSLESLFAEYGAVKDAQVVQDRDTGRSKGFGFVEMADGAQAQKAIAGLNLKEVDGRCLTVNEARPREERGGSRGGGRGYGGGRGRY